MVHLCMLLICDKITIRYQTSMVYKLVYSVICGKDMYLHPFTFHQAVQHVLDLPLSLSAMMPAHTPNWDAVSDIVNDAGSIYRSPKQCRQRYESVVIHREEDSQNQPAVLEPITPKKKSKGSVGRSLNFFSYIP